MALLYWNVEKRQWEWEGSVKELVDAVGDGDARLGFVLDRKSGARVSMDMSSVDESDPEHGTPGYEPFHVESPDHDNLYDARNRREAVALLTNIRKGMKYPDTDGVYTAPARKPKPKRKKPSPKPSIRGIGR